MERQRSRSCDRGGSNSAKSSNAEELDPRIHMHLEELNTSTHQINKLEKELEETNERFRTLLNAHTGALGKLMHKFKKEIDKARPFYLAKAEADALRTQLLSSTISFQKANDIHAEAKKSVQQTEARYNNNGKESQIDGACQELLNHLTIQVMEAAKEKSKTKTLHRVLSEKFFEAEKKVQELGKLLQKDIDKSRSFFEMKYALDRRLLELKNTSIQLQKSIADAKRAYSMALCNLEMISEEIHQNRGVRIPCEGAEQLSIKQVDE